VTINQRDVTSPYEYQLTNAAISLTTHHYYAKHALPLANSNGITHIKKVTACSAQSTLRWVTFHNSPATGVASGQSVWE